MLRKLAEQFVNEAARLFDTSTEIGASLAWGLASVKFHARTGMTLTEFYTKEEHIWL